MPFKTYPIGLNTVEITEAIPLNIKLTVENAAPNTVEITVPIAPTIGARKSYIHPNAHLSQSNTGPTD